MDKIAELMSNELVMLVVAILAAIVVLKIVKKVISAIVTAVLIVVVFMGASYYFDGIKENFNIALNDGTLNVKLLDKTYDIDVDYIENIEVTDKEDGKQIVFNSTKKDAKDITVNIPDMAYLIVVKPLAHKLDIDIVNK